MSSKYLYTFLFFVVVFSLTACLPDDAPIPKRVAIVFNVNNVGTEISSGDDTIQVSEFKLFLQKFIISTGEEARLEANKSAIMRYRAQNDGQDAEVLAGQLGYDFSTFDGIEIFINQPAELDNIPDRDLVDNGERFSIFLSGTYNGEDFEYKSHATFDKDLPFSKIGINADAETLYLRLISDIQKIIINPDDDKIISPEPANSVYIDSLIKQSFHIEASVKASLPFN